MNWNLTAKIGLKVLAAAIAGVAIFIGIDKATKQQPHQENPQPQTLDGSQQPLPQQEEKKDSGDLVVSGLRGAQDTCHKLFDVTQSLTSLAESLGRLFRGDNRNVQYNQPYYQDPWCNNYNGNSGGGWNRVSPFIIQATPVKPIYNSGNYPY